MKKFLSKLIKENIHINLVEGELSVKIPNKGVDPSIIDEIKSRKQDLIEYLSNLKKNENSISDYIDNVPKSEHYSISNAQQRLWVLSQFENSSAAYNMFNSIMLEGNYDIDSFKRSIWSVLERHEILRTVFRQDSEGIAHQIVLELSELGFNVRYKNFCKEENPEQCAKNYMQKDSYVPFDLEKGPLLRVSLLQLTDTTYIFYYNMHHIISDGWSMNILSRDIFSYYNHYAKGEELILPTLRIQYKDYAAWQLKQLETETYQVHRQYWLEKLSGDLPILDLPTFKNRPLLKTHNGRDLSTYLSVEDTKSMRAYVKEKGGTLFMFLLASLKVLFHRYTGQEDIVVGSSSAGREHSDLEDQIGFYINTLAIRSIITSDMLFDEFYEQLKQDLLDAQAHQKYPFDRLIEELDLNMDASRRSFSDVRVILQNTVDIQEASVVAQEDVGSIKDHGETMSKFDVLFAFAEAGDHVAMGVTYNTDVYDYDMIAGLMNHYQNLVRKIVKEDNIGVGKLEYIEPSERSEVLYDFSTESIDYPEDKTILDLFSDQVTNTPNSIALVFEDIELTYKELDDYSSRLAYNLQNNYNIVSGDLIGIMLPVSSWSIISILGVLKSGAGYVPIDPDTPTNRVQYLINDTKAKTLLTDSIGVSSLEPYSFDTLDVIAFCNLFEGKNVFSLLDKPSSEDIAYVIYTSGSTGKPKGVMITHANLIDYTNGLFENTNIRSCHSFALMSNIATDLGNTIVYGSLLSGGTLYLPKKDTLRNVDEIHEYFTNHSIDCIKIVPTHWKALSKEDVLLLPHRMIIFGGDVLPVTHVGSIKFQAPGLEIINHYGPTETTIGKLLLSIDSEVSYSSIPIGTPFSKTSVYVVDDYLNICPFGVSGELLIGGKGVGKGYLNNPELTAEVFIQNPFTDNKEKVYKTGDLVRMLPNGNIEFIGRKDDQVKVNGHRIELKEVESALIENKKLHEIYVLTKETIEGLLELVAYFTSSEEISVKEIIGDLKLRLPEHMIPSSFVKMEKFPLTSNGKIDRKKLLNIGKQEFKTEKDYKAPRNEDEEKIVQIWEGILQRKNIGIEDSFFEIGGHSIKAILLLNKYQKLFNVKIAISDLFANTTIVSQLALIKNLKKEKFIKIQKVEKSDSYPISYGQRRLWILSQFNNGSAAYNIPYWLKLKEAYDKEALENAILKTIERHEILRTQFKINKEGEVRQYIMNMENVDFKLTYKEFINNSEQAFTYIKDDVFKAFNLENGMLLRATLLRISDEEYYFYFNMHHIISDGWSMEVLSKDILHFYKSYISQQMPSLNNLTIQYKDYASWQLSQVESDKYLKSKEYWLEKLSGELPKISLPNSMVRPTIRTYRGKSMSTYIDKNITSLVKKYTLNNDGSIYISLLSTLLVLLNRYTSDKDIIVGSPVAARDHFDLKDQIGFYVNTIAFRNSINTEITFDEFYNQIRKSALEDYNHQMYPFDKLIEEMNLIKDTSRNPIFDIMLTLQNNRDNNHLMNSLDKEEIDLINEHSNIASKFDLEIIFEEVADCLSFSINYNTDIYTSDSIREIIFHFKTLIRLLFENPQNIIGSVNFLSEREEQLLLKKFNDTILDYSGNRTILDYFEDQLHLRPNDIAIDFEGKELTYIQVSEISNQLAHYLIHEYDIAKEDIIAVELQRSEWMVLSILGILKSGAAYVPIAPDYPQNRISYIKADTNCKVCIDIDELNKFNKENYPNTRPKITINENDLAYVIYTSGSTGNPKGVLIEHQGMMNRFLWMIEDLGINSDDVFLQKTPYTFDVSVWELLVPFMCGSKLVIAKPEGHKSPDYLESIIISKGVTIIHFVPSMLKIATEMITWNDVSKLRHVICSGEAMSVQLENKFKEVYSKGDLHNYYGPTEASIDVTKVNLTKKSSKDTLVSIGKPVDNTEIFIVNELLALQPLGVAGEILIGGVQLAREYLNKEDLTRQKFIISPFDKNKRLYKSGDIGRFLPDGSIQYIGRKDNQIKIRGNRVELGEIENAIYNFDLIDQVVVTVREKQKDDKELVAFFISKEELDTRELISYLKTLIPYYMIPSYLIRVDEIPLNLNGKVDTKQLLKLSDNYKDEVTNYVAPTNDVEEKLVVIVENILDHKDIGVEDDFFLLGGDSIKLIRLRNEILSSFEIKIGIEDLFTLRNIKEVADYILNLQWNITEQEKEDVEGVSFTI